ncbi:hypothetical protein ACOSQ2_018297 [Xanthoceras sorbifolium]
MRAVIVQSGVQKALKGVKPADMKDADWEDIDEKACSAIQLSLSDEFESLITDLQNLDVNIKDEDQALLLLCSLPSLYRHFREKLC